MVYNIQNKYGPIISDDESIKILSELEKMLEKSNDKIEIDFSGVIAMTTKSAKTIFGNLYLKLSASGFYNKLAIINATSTIQEIIYDAIVNNIKNKTVNF